MLQTIKMLCLIFKVALLPAHPDQSLLIAFQDATVLVRTSSRATLPTYQHLCEYYLNIRIYYIPQTLTPYSLFTIKYKLRFS